MSAIAVAGPKEPVDPIRAFIDRTAGRLFVSAGFTPNQVTILGTVVALAGCVLWTQQARWEPLFWVSIGLGLVGASLDSCDGSVARLRDMHTPFGRLLDSTTDRVVETGMFAGLVWTMTASWGAVGCVLAVGGSFMVSYVRSKAEQADLKGTDGWGPRQVRLPLLAICVLLGHWYGWGWVAWPVAGLAWLTVTQRLSSVKRQLSSPVVDPMNWGHGGQL